MLWTLRQEGADCALCTRCAPIVRESLLALPSPPEALPVGPIALPQTAWLTRLRWFATRWATYASVAAAAFVVATWLAAR